MDENEKTIAANVEIVVAEVEVFPLEGSTSLGLVPLDSQGSTSTADNMFDEEDCVASLKTTFIPVDLESGPLQKVFLHLMRHVPNKYRCRIQIVQVVADGATEGGQ